MIPVQLTIQGLYSYQVRQTIDFTKLTAAGLFGIFGPVGSGKSSVLEAITFAIYGRTDRLNLSGDNRYYNMMNLKSDELLIDFWFETGKEQTAYRAMARGKRSSKRFDEVKTLERAAYQMIGQEWVPIEIGKLEEAIGLSYDNFKRTIIIPQGQFQEFLQLGNKDRTQMMKELFSLGKYEFYHQVVSLETKNNTKKQLIEGQLQQLGTLDPEQEQKYRDLLMLLEKEIRAQQLKLAENQQKEEELRKLQELTRKITETEKEQRKLQEQEPLFQSLEMKINRYEQGVILFQHLLNSLHESRKKKEIREAQIRHDSDKIKEEEVEIWKLEKQIEAIKPAYEKREELKRKAEELISLLQIKTLEKSVGVEMSRLNKGTETWDHTLNEIKRLKIQKENLEGELKAARDALPDLSVLSGIKSWYIARHHFDKQLQDIENELQKSHRQEEEILEVKFRLLTAPLFEGLSGESGFKEYSQHLKNVVRNIKENQKQLAEQEGHLRVKEQLKVFAEDLEEGKPCPVCGSLHHPELLKSEAFHDTLQLLAAEKSSLELQLDRISTLEKELSLLENRQIQLLHNREELLKKKETQQAQIAAHILQFVWEADLDEKKVDEAFLQAKNTQDELKEKDASLQKTAGELEKQERNRERFREELEKIRTSLTVHRTELKTITQQLRWIDPEQYRETSVLFIEEEKNHLLKEYVQLEKEYSEKSNLLPERKRIKDVLSGTLNSNRKELEQDLLIIDKITEALNTQLEKSSFRSLQEVKEILSTPMNMETEKQRLARFKELLQQCNSTLRQLHGEAGDRVYDAGAHQTILGEIAMLREQTTRKIQEQGKTTEQLEKLQKDMESQSTLRKELEQLELRSENIRTLKSLFKASGFVDYISSIYLQNLCNAANDRFFQLTRQKLSLEITPDNNFQVRDFMNGGKVRSVKTLSGGQTFQASLSLALALADNIQKITRSNQNFFFLDEGFGSLDAASLNIVFDTLKSLRKENRVVGVISHVEEMQQEIEVHLRVENQEEKGSIIHQSWEE
ncbi:MAG: AAA family ATPase [Porphyromonadaceae bacterium]|nr:AAA family ATPase [Porphyromonadaceae bacterium]